MLNQIQANNISDQNVKIDLKNWFGLDTSNDCCEIKILEPKFERTMNDNEMKAFDLDYNFTEKPITIGNRLQIKNVIYHSSNYLKVGHRRCNFIVRFKGDNPINYGIIRYFFVLNGIYFVALNELYITKIISDNLKGRASVALIELKKIGILNRFFAETEISQNIIFISPCEILTKCIVREIKSGFLVSQFDLENDYN